MDKKKRLPRARRVERKEFLINICRQRSVLHLGCTGGFLDERSIQHYDQHFDKKGNLHANLAMVARKIAGLDTSYEKIEVLKQVGMPGTFYVGDITSPSLELHDQYEIILFAELIEHLDNVKSAFYNCKKLMRCDSNLVITTCNAFDIKTFIKLLGNYESVNPEHTAYYSYLTIKRLLTMNGLEIVDFYYAHEKRDRFTSIIDRVSYYGSHIFSTYFPQFSQHLIFIARLDSSLEMGK